MPFELQRPDANTPVTNTSEIDHNSGAQTQPLNDVVEAARLKTKDAPTFYIVTRDGFYLLDNLGNIGFKFGINGSFDAINFGEHTSKVIQGLVSSYKTIKKGFHVTDAQGNIAALIDKNGNFDAIGLGDNLKSIIRSLNVGGSYKTAQQGFYITDIVGNVAMKVDKNGKLDAIDFGTNLRSIIAAVASTYAGGGDAAEGIRTSDIDTYRNNDGSVNTFTLTLANIGRVAPMVLSSRAYYTGATEPYLQITVGAYTSPKYTIGSDIEYSAQNWRIPPMLQGMTGNVKVTVPSGTTLYIKDFSSSYDLGTNDCGGVRLDAHLGFQGYAPENSMPSYEYAAMCGYTACIVTPILSSDGVFMCYHENNSTLSLDGGTTIVSLSASDFQAKTYTELMAYDVCKNSTMAGLFPNCKIPTLDDFFKLCARTGMRPMFSTHPNLTTTQWQTVKDMLIKYGLLSRFTVKAFSASWLRSAYAVLGNDIDAYIYDVENSNWSTYISNMNDLKTDGCTVRMGIECKWALATQAGISDILAAGYFASVWNIPATPTSSKYKELLSWGVTEFTDDKNCSNGLNW